MAEPKLSGVTSIYGVFDPLFDIAFGVAINMLTILFPPVKILLAF